MEIVAGPLTLTVEPEEWASGPVVGLALARETGSTTSADEHGIWIGTTQARDLGFYILGASGLIRPEVLRFARLMEEKLARHDGDKAGWRDTDPAYLAYDLGAHVAKLAERANGHAPTAATRAQTASDIADCLNFLMMIADVCGLLPVGEGESDAG